jgi:hypothetical protein
MNIQLHIERLVMEGLPVDDIPRMSAALEGELNRRLMQGTLSGEFRRNDTTARVTGGTIRITKAQPAAKLGAQLAGVIYQAIGRGSGT